MRQIKGLWWPDGDVIAYQVITAEVSFLDRAIEHTRNTGLVIQAGGNAGVYPLYLAERFDQVVTFEPEAANFACLEKNVEGHDNITAVNMALGDRVDLVGITRCRGNTGAGQINDSGSDVKMMPLDDLGLNPDLIQLDIEGFEQHALEGARETIARSRPVIMVEDVGHGATIGVLTDWIESEFNYELVGTNGNDYILRAKREHHDIRGIENSGS